MEVSDSIRSRRSIRRFKADPVPKEFLDAILEAVQWAPSWGNSQCWELIIVKDKARRELLNDTLSKTNSAKKSLVEAPLALVVCGKEATSGYYKGKATTRWGEWTLFDCALAVQNICLEALSLGLGSVIIGEFDHDKVEKILKVPKNFSVVCMVPIGYPSKISKAPSRKPISDFIHNETFGK
jgi:nitroreductase